MNYHDERIVTIVDCFVPSILLGCKVDSIHFVHSYIFQSKNAFWCILYFCYWIFLKVTAALITKKRIQYRWITMKLVDFLICGTNLEPNNECRKDIVIWLMIQKILFFERLINSTNIKFWLHFKIAHQRTWVINNIQVSAT